MVGSFSLTILFEINILQTETLNMIQFCRNSHNQLDEQKIQTSFSVSQLGPPRNSLCPNTKRKKKKEIKWKYGTKLPLCWMHTCPLAWPHAHIDANTTLCLNLCLCLFISIRTRALLPLNQHTMEIKSISKHSHTHRQILTYTYKQLNRHRSPPATRHPPRTSQSTNKQTTKAANWKG